VKRYIVSVIDGFICAVVFNITAYTGAGIASIISILIFCIIFGSFLFYRTNKYDNVTEFIFYAVSSIVFIVSVHLLSLHFSLFYNIFAMFHSDYGKSNAGSGFGMIISLFLNSMEYIIIISSCLVRLLSELKYKN